MARMAGPETTLAPASFEEVELEGKLVLFNNRVCPFGHRAWWTMLEKEVEDFVYAHIDLGETKPAFYKAEVNPSGTVPCLYDNGEPVFESLVCAAYLEDRFADQGTKLKPDDEKERETVQEVIDFFDSSCMPLLYRLLMNQDASKDAAIAEDLQAALQELNALYEAQNEDGPYLLGDRLSLADIAIVPFLDRFSATLPYYRGFNPLEAGVPRLVQLYEAAKSRPAFAETSQDPDFYTHFYESYGKVKRTMPKSQI